GHGACVEQDDKGWDARKRAYCLKIQPATGSFARNLIYSTKPIEAISSGRFDVKSMVTHIYDYRDVQQAFEESVNNKRDIIKGVIKISD
ncbi:hypothetical protein NGH03_23410, partial [Escherichia coli]|nr:hypothetical protein [Escherichia coli]